MDWLPKKFHSSDLPGATTMLELEEYPAIQEELQMQMQHNTRMAKVDEAVLTAVSASLPVAEVARHPDP